VGHLSSKWAEQLSSKCNIEAKFLQYAVEELSESCYGDTKTSKEIIEELTLSCHFDSDELRKFIDQVSKNCPIDVAKLKDAVIRAEGEKGLAYEAIGKAGKDIAERGAIR
jgi:Cft2 family RNA processing exonuclease